jgi:hypothetical protein
MELKVIGWLWMGSIRIDRLQWRILLNASLLVKVLLETLNKSRIENLGICHNILEQKHVFPVPLPLGYFNWL